MKIHTLHVKNGHCTIIEHEKRNTLIDIHKLSESDMVEEVEETFLLTEAYTKLSAGGYVYTATNPINYWNNKIVGLAFRTIITHPDQDHIRGFKEFFDSVGTTNVWIPTKHKDTMPNTEDGKLLNSIIDGNVENVTFIEPKRGDDNQFFGLKEPDWDQIEILHPTSSFESETTNQGSYLVKIRYGTSSVIIGGDVEKETFKWLYENYPNELKCTVFIASHHGRQSGWPGKEIIQHMNPLMVVIPKGKILPKDSALGYYREALGNERFITTSYAGNIRISLTKYDDISEFECERSYVNEQLADMLETARRLRRDNIVNLV